jgi:hypothetical protein
MSGTRNGRVAQDVSTRRVSWGEGIVVAAFRQRGGLKVAVDRIHEVVGDYVGVRNSFAKLQRIESPDDLNDRDAFRAWLLLTALAERPPEWGIADAAVPPGFDIDRLRQRLVPTTPGGPDGGQPVTDTTSGGKGDELARLTAKKRSRAATRR